MRLTRAVGQGQVLVEHLESVGHRQEAAHRHRRHHQRDDDPAHNLTVRCAIDLRGLDQISRQALEACNVDDHHIANLLPAHQNDHAPEAIDRRRGQGTVPQREDAVQQQLPDIAQHDAADEVRHEEHRAEQIRPAHRLGEHIGQQERDDIDDDGRHDGEQHRPPQRGSEFGIRKRIHIILQPHPLGIGHRPERGKAQVDTHGKRHDEEHRETQRCR